MVPSGELLTEPIPGSRVLANGRAVPALREELRRIPSVRNGVSVVSCYVQTLALLWLAAITPGWWKLAVWPVVFVLMGRAHAQFAALMHEAAHRLLFRNKTANDVVGRWLLGYPAYVNTDGYRRVHMAHHRDEFGPDEPDIALYAAYPITRSSLRRKLTRDATGRTGMKLLKQQLGNLVGNDQRSKSTTAKIYGLQVVLAVTAWLLGSPLVYWVLWFLPFITVWRVINRLRSIAEHGGMQRSKDRRETTHTVRQHMFARFLLVPYWIGWHLAHHCDSGVPMRNLPRYHRELIASGYVPASLEYQSYPALWRSLSARPAA
jgi:fatty acid desaturase